MDGQTKGAHLELSLVFSLFVRYVEDEECCDESSVVTKKSDPHFSDAAPSHCDPKRTKYWDDWSDDLSYQYHINNKTPSGMLIMHQSKEDYDSSNKNTDDDPVTTVVQASDARFKSSQIWVAVFKYLYINIISYTVVQ